MITTIALAFMLSRGFPLLHESNDASANAPQVRCEIELTSWCIAVFDGSINMDDVHQERIWKLQGREGMDAGPLVIVEQKACHDLASEKIELIGSTKIKTLDGKKYQSTKYRITTNGCELEFLWPAAVQDASTYKQTMLFGILVGYGKGKQLYKP